MAAPFLRVALRRHLKLPITRRLPRPPRRHQSSGPSSGGKEPKTEDPIPVQNTVGPLPFWQRLGPLTRAGQAYARAQRRRPWATQVTSTLVIYFCADLSAQHMSGNSYDPKRTMRSLIIGGASSIPSYTWFMWLSRNFNYSSHLLSIAAKITVNQTFFTPVFNTYFFGAQALLSGDTLSETWERVKMTVPVSIANSLKLWPAVTAFSFTYVPLEYRSVFAGVVAVGWQTYLSFLNRQAELREDSQKMISAAAAEHEKHASVTTTHDVDCQKRRLPAYDNSP
ncbi:hypothetical protein DL764_006649 [Monosporascus ibericus]|uniref:Uncharacterized protein n=1 Tax=Monosporascus ibericus TaxID=155417 RepID=A0A4Q4T667_9PEZI|nr:hypothetical protein DL764_006649 [Monosporascus ibericus]